MRGPVRSWWIPLHLPLDALITGSNRPLGLKQKKYYNLSEKQVNKTNLSKAENEQGCIFN